MNTPLQTQESYDLLVHKTVTQDKPEQLIANSVSWLDRALRLLCATAIIFIPFLLDSVILNIWIYLVTAVPFIAVLLVYLVITGLSGKRSILDRTK